MKSLARWLFRLMARGVLARYRPTIVAVAGSIGKTATKDAIAAALGSERQVRKTIGNFNAEVGVPVTIIAGGGARQGLGWLGVPVAGLRTWLVKSKYPDALVLELGSDKPGDLAPLLSLVRPTVGVLTAIAPEHMEFFGDLDAVAREEASVIQVLGPEQTGVVNIDDPLVQASLKHPRGRIIRYGWSVEADVRAEHLEITFDSHGRPTGQTVKVAVAGSVVPVGLTGVIGRHQAYPLLAALGVAQALGIPLSRAIEGLTQYQPPPGRMRLLAGLAGSTLIDDSYNASPQAVTAALETLASIPSHGRRVAILGQMSELGTAAVAWHTKIGATISQRTCDQLITVGPLAEHFGQAAVAHGFPAEQVTNVPNAEAAAAEVRSRLGPNDIVLLKGSRYAARLERAAKLLLEHPARDTQWLVGPAAL